MAYILFLIGFFLLIYGANFLVDGAVSLGKKFKMPGIIIGLTIVSIGTSAPEMIISTIATNRGATGLAISNVLGSNIFNTLIIIGVAAFLSPIKIQKNTAFKEIPFSFLAAVSLFLLVSDRLINGSETNILSRSDGMILLLFFIIFMFYAFATAKNGNLAEDDEVAGIKEMKYGKSVIYIIIGIGGLFLGGKWIVSGATEVASLLGLNEKIIGLTIVATATSLPELVTSIIAARRNQSGIAIGNAIGSNIFNVFLILGISALISPLPFDASLMPDVMITMLSNIIIFLFSLMIIGGTRMSISRTEGVFLLLIYIGFIYYKIKDFI